MAKDKKGADAGQKIIVVNRKARHEYIFEEFYECGISLVGTEVKSLRAGRVSIVEAFAQVEKYVRKGVERYEVWLKNLNISHWETGNRFNHDPFRARRLLLHAREIRRLCVKTQEKGLTLVPTKLYFKEGRVKVELAVSRGKKLYDKRDAEAAKSAQRDIDRAMKNMRE